MARVDPARTATVDELPEVPRETWTRAMHSGIELPVAIDETGAIVVAATGGDVVQLHADGTEQWKSRVGISGPSTGPVITSDRTRVVLTSLGEVWGLSPTGRVKFRLDLSGMGRDPRVAPLPRDDGTVVVGVASRVAVLGPDGSLLDHTSAGELIVGAIVAVRNGVLVTTDSGSVLVWSPPLTARLVGSFKGSAREGAALVDERSVVAVVDHHKLVSMDLRTGTLTTLASAPWLDGPPTAGPHAVAYAATSSGLLLGVSSRSEVLRVAVQPQASGGEDGGTGGIPAHRADPPLLVDRSSRVAFARSDGRVGIVLPSGAVRLASTAGCPEPTGLTPAGRARFVVTCRSGAIKMYGP